MIQRIVLIAISFLSLGLVAAAQESPSTNQAADAVSLSPINVAHEAIEPNGRCNECVRPYETRPGTRYDLPGFRGRPYIAAPVGGCQCGHATGVTRHPNASAHWPRPLSASVDQALPQFSNWMEQGVAPAITSPFDRLGNFRGLPYQRRDSGYCGPGRDPYGCLGESRAANNVSGIGYRIQSEPFVH